MPCLCPEDARDRGTRQPVNEKGGKSIIRNPQNTGPPTAARPDHDKLEIALDKAGLKKVMENFVRAE